MTELEDTDIFKNRELLIERMNEIRRQWVKARAAIRELKRRQNTLILAAREQGMTYGQIGKHIGLSKTGVRDREKSIKGYKYKYLKPGKSKVWFKER